MFVLIAKSGKVLEWSRETDASSAVVETIDDACFASPLRTAGLVDASLADEAVLRALLQKGHPIFDEVRNAGVEAGREEGREQRREEGLRLAVIDLCESHAVDLDDARRDAIAAMTRAELDALRATLERDRRWPRS